MTGVKTVRDTVYNSNWSVIIKGMWFTEYRIAFVEEGRLRTACYVEKGLATDYELRQHSAMCVIREYEDVHLFIV